MMKHIFATTALVSLLGVAVATAQQTEPVTQSTAPDTMATTSQAEIIPPEGYVQSDVVLTTENLEGATVYDVSSDEIGEVHGLIFANGTTSIQQGLTEGAVTDTTTTDAMTPDTMDGQSQSLDSTEISQAIIDVGGFLGMGTHRVAVPISDLRVFHSGDQDDLRIYLPWTREQLEALPEFDEDNPVPALQ